MNPEPIDLEELASIIAELGLGESWLSEDYNPTGLASVYIGTYEDLSNKVGHIHYMDATTADKFVTVLQALPQLIAMAKAAKAEK